MASADVVALAQSTAEQAAHASDAILPNLFTVDTLPAAADNLDRYARVTDLFGSKRDLVLASRVGTVAFW